jgi:biotin carboxyl carrier protein
MLKIKVNNQITHTVTFSDADQASGKLDDIPFTWDLITVKEGSFHAIKDNKSYAIELIQADTKQKTMEVRVNGNRYSLVIKDKFDELLQSLGMDASSASKINELKAPMPGLVLDIRVNIGDIVKKGDPLLVLEAMKMENSIKSPGDGTIKRIHVEKGLAVEKNQVLVSFN